MFLAPAAATVMQRWMHSRIPGHDAVEWRTEVEVYVLERDTMVRRMCCVDQGDQGSLREEGSAIDGGGGRECPGHGSQSRDPLARIHLEDALKPILHWKFISWSCHPTTHSSEVSPSRSQTMGKQTGNGTSSTSPRAQD